MCYQICHFGETAWYSRLSSGLEVRESPVKLPFFPCCVTMGKPFNLSEPWLCHLKSEDKNPSCPRPRWRLNERLCWWRKVRSSPPPQHRNKLYHIFYWPKPNNLSICSWRVGNIACSGHHRCCRFSLRWIDLVNFQVKWMGQRDVQVSG